MNAFGLSFAFQVLILGFCVVMVTLVALYLVLILFNRIFTRKVHEHGEKDKLSSTTSVGFPEHLFVNSSEEKRITAAIFAAIYEYMKADRSFIPAGFMVTAATDVKAAENSWRLSGRKDMLESQLKLEELRRKKQHEEI